MQHDHQHDAQRRRFSRIRFECGATLVCAGRRTDCEVRDLSLKGALVSLPGGPLPGLGEPCVLELLLDEETSRIRMEGAIAHVADRGVGVAWREIDLESLTHLRRLLELNLGDCELMHRELSALLSP